MTILIERRKQALSLSQLINGFEEEEEDGESLIILLVKGFVACWDSAWIGELSFGQAAAGINKDS